jgi:rhomboid protease GluP
MPNCIKYKPTYILIAVNIAVYIATSIASGNVLNTNQYVMAQWGQWNFAVYNGWYYQLFSSMFVHASIAHIGGNMLFLLIFGLRGEELFSLPEYLGVYLGAGLAGNLLSLALGPNLISVGASGAIFGLFGAIVLYSRSSVRQSLLGGLIYAFFLFFITGFGPGVNWVAHFGGLSFGLLVGYLLSKRRKPQEQYTSRRQYSTAMPF